jgi:pheromone shutdown protein TraB
MLGAVEGARDIEADLFFIDRDIEATERRLGEAFILEFLNPVEILRKVMLFPVVFLSMPRWGSSLEEVVKEFERAPEKYRKLLGRAFPVFKRVLLDEREEHMAGRIRKVLERFDEVAVVTGAGHAADLKKLLDDFDVEVVPLTKLLDG